MFVVAFFRKGGKSDSSSRRIGSSLVGTRLRNSQWSRTCSSAARTYNEARWARVATGLGREAGEHGQG